MAAQDFKYDAFILYNKANSPLSNTPDTDLSLKFTEYLVGRLHDWGFQKSWYHGRNSRPGSNIFMELMRLVNTSRWTMVILTQGFLDDCWSQYSSQTAFKKLLDKRMPHKLIPISIGLKDDELPDELNVSDPICFSNDWKTDNEHSQNTWLKLENLLKNVEDHSQADRHIHREEAGDNVTRSERGVPVVQNLDPHKTILDRCRSKLVEGFETEMILDALVGTEMFAYSTLNDIRQIRPQSDQNRCIVDLIRKSGLSAYKTFRTILQQLQLENMWAKNILEALSQEESRLNIIDGTLSEGGGDKLAQADTLDQPDFKQQKLEQQSSVSAEQEATPSIPPSATLYHSIDTHNWATGAAIQPVESSPANGHATTIYTRQMTESLASLTIEEDTSPPTPQPSMMRLETGPRLSCPPPVTNQSAPADQSNQPPSSNQSTPRAQSPTVNQSTQSNEAALLNQPTEQTEQAVMNIPNTPSMAATPPNSPEIQSNVHSGVKEIYNSLMNETVPQTFMFALEAEANRNNSNSNIIRDEAVDEILEEAVKAEQVPDLQHQQNLSRDDDLVIDNNHESLVVDNTGIPKPSQARLNKDLGVDNESESLVIDNAENPKSSQVRFPDHISGLESGPDLALNSLLDNQSITSSGYSSCGSLATSQKPSPESPNVGEMLTPESLNLGKRSTPESPNLCESSTSESANLGESATSESANLGESLTSVSSEATMRLTPEGGNEQPGGWYKPGAGIRPAENRIEEAERVTKEEGQPPDSTVLLAEGSNNSKTEMSTIKPEMTTSASVLPSSQSCMPTVHYTEDNTTDQTESTGHVRGETTSVRAESDSTFPSVQAEPSQPSMVARLFGTVCSLVTQPEVAYTSWQK